jgi:hypothetical protein
VARIRKRPFSLLLWTNRDATSEANLGVALRDKAKFGMGLDMDDAAEWGS